MATEHSYGESKGIRHVKRWSGKQKALTVGSRIELSIYGSCSYGFRIDAAGALQIFGLPVLISVPWALVHKDHLFLASLYDS